MKTLLILSVTLLVSIQLLAQTPKVSTGIEVLKSRNFDVLSGKKVGLITNPTGVDWKLESTIDILFRTKQVKLAALFGPEHGVRGDFSAGDEIGNQTDEATHLPVYSLYGKTRKPTAEMLKGIDALVYDIQDIGCRSYTYISTMGLAMEAAAENNIEFIVLDRPNPLGGLKVEGNILEKGFESFVGQYQIPYVYGLTCGELAKMLNEEGMLDGGKKCKLTVVPMKGWKRDMRFEETGLQWVPASPHIPMESSPQYYVATGILGELGVISEGVGYTIPFRTIAAEWIKPKELADKLNGLHINGVLFRPLVFKPFYGKWKDKELKGVQIHITDYSVLNLMSIQFLCMQVLNEMYPENNPFTLADGGRLKMFDKVMGSSQPRQLFEKKMRYDDLKVFFEKDVQAFTKRARKYWLY
jgi:uncharacterized protein YbbC (DUF1343 family)